MCVPVCTYVSLSRRLALPRWRGSSMAEVLSPPWELIDICFYPICVCTRTISILVRRKYMSCAYIVHTRTYKVTSNNLCITRTWKQLKSNFLFWSGVTTSSHKNMKRPLDCLIHKYVCAANKTILISFFGALIVTNFRLRLLIN